MVSRAVNLAVSAIFLTGLSAGQVQATARYVHRDKIAMSGRMTVIEHSAEVNVDCSVKAIPSARVVMAPKHGRLSEARSKEAINFQPPNPRVRCNNRKLDGITFYYTSDPGFVGHDSIEIYAAFSTGSVDDVKIDITVK